MVSLPQMARTLVMWTAPLVLTVPMFSKDVYSYLAQSEIAARGLDPYTVGPAEALGNADPLTRGVPTMWRDTPSPYGPLFLTIGRGITWLTGEHVVMGVVFQRLLALIGFAMIVWALPRLARRFGINPVSALWLGAANPLVLFHLVVGIHNESLAIGLMLVGIELGLRKMPRCGPSGPFRRGSAASCSGTASARRDLSRRRGEDPGGAGARLPRRDDRAALGRPVVAPAHHRRGADGDLPRR